VNFLLPFVMRLLTPAFAVWPLIFSARADDLSLDNKPVVSASADGHLEVFKVDPAGTLSHRWQIPAQGDWSRWSQLGAGVFAGIGTATNAQGCLEVYAVDRLTHELRCVRQKTPDSVEWSGWISLGGAIRPPVTAAQSDGGAVDLFAVDDSSSEVRHLWRAGPWAEWSEWSGMGGALKPG
jgi:hypothetical protein